MAASSFFALDIYLAQSCCHLVSINDGYLKNQKAFKNMNPEKNLVLENLKQSQKNQLYFSGDENFNPCFKTFKIGVPGA